jgi:hypothetical protein
VTTRAEKAAPDAWHPADWTEMHKEEEAFEERNIRDSITAYEKE